jgi:hypothetical protein
MGAISKMISENRQYSVRGKVIISSLEPQVIKISLLMRNFSTIIVISKNKTDY